MYIIIVFDTVVITIIVKFPGHFYLVYIYTVQFTQYNVLRTMYTVQCTQCNVHSAMYTVLCTQYNVHSAMYKVQCTQYNVHSTMYTVQCTKYNAQSTGTQYRYTVQVHSTCTQYNVHSTMYTVHRRDILFVFILNILLNGARDCPLSLVTPNFGVLTLSRLSSGLPQNRCGTGDPPPLPFPYCDTNLQHLIHFWKALGLYLNNLQNLQYK